MIGSRRERSAWSVGRRGSILPTLVLTMVALTAFLGLAIDVGMLAVAKTQTQLAADLAALAAARTMNGDASVGYNQTAATTNAQNVLTYNLILGQSIQSSQLQLSYGSYDYNQTTQLFSANFPKTAGQPSTAVAATVTSTSLPAAFGKILGTQFLPSVSATSQAVHRPRDIALIMDLSTSMRFGTCLGFDWYTSSRGTNNPDSLVPTFGHYSSASANMQGPSGSRVSAFDPMYQIGASNTTATSASYSLTYVNNFYQNAAYATPLVRAFDSYTSSDGGATWAAPTSGSPLLPPSSYASVPGGDVPLFLKGSTTTYATSVKDVLGGTTTRSPAWELDGYSNYTNGTLSNAAVGDADYTSAPFEGYTQGPGYYGVTFFIWPPDPRQHLATSTDAAQIKQFLMDFGYTATDFSSGTTGPPLSGTYNVTSTPGSHVWPWPNDGPSGTTLSTYLTSKVYIPGGGRKLKTSDTQYQQIMRLYNWDYVIDNVGTTSCDWRMRFFGTADNTVLFSTSTGSMKTPGSGSYTINYNEILRWLNQNPNPFPSQLRAGRIKYYGAIPTAITGTWPSYGSTDQRFWVEFIDNVLGFRQTSAGVYQDISDMLGYGGEFNWGAPSLTTVPSASQYMKYTDMPARPTLRFWFGPMAMVDYLQNSNMYEQLSNYRFLQPGDSYEAPLYPAKQSYLAAVDTMQTNHPNDGVSVVAYSTPRTSASDSYGRFNCVSSPMGNNYAYATSALSFPFSTINADGSCNNTEITPYDPDPATGQVPSANFMDTPRASGSTCFSMALMLAYNQFATTPTSDTTLRTYVTNSPITFPTGMAGGLGRKGAQKLVIFETDGVPNETATATLVTNGAYKYYKVRYNMNSPSGSEYPSLAAYGSNDPTVLAQINGLVQQLATDYGTTRNPFRLYALGFGPVFTSSSASSALSTLQGMQYYAGTQSNAATPLPANQIITGTDSQMSSSMISAFTSILQNGVQIALIK